MLFSTRALILGRIRFGGSLFEFCTDYIGFGPWLAVHYSRADYGLVYGSLRLELRIVDILRNRWLVSFSSFCILSIGMISQMKLMFRDYHLAETRSTMSRKNDRKLDLISFHSGVRKSGGIGNGYS
jgi:hypothetical protein